MNTRLKDDREGAATLEILNTISSRNDITQRHLADRLGVALGMANSYLKRCVKKGFVKIQQAPANRYLYYVTPQGFVEKSRLTREYLTSSFDFYRRASADLREIGERIRANGAQSVMFAGVSELAEIGSFRIEDAGLLLVGTFEPRGDSSRFINCPLWQDLTKIEPADACVFTALESRSDIFEALGNCFDSDEIYIPEIIRPLIIETNQSQGLISEGS